VFISLSKDGDEVPVIESDAVTAERNVKQKLSFSGYSKSFKME
jgi:hypothetical protein